MPRIVPDRDKYRRYYLDEDYVHELHNGDLLHLGKGFRFDAHSVPWWIRWCLPKYDERDIYAALIHDFMVDTAPWHRYPRKFIDKEYAILMNQYSYGFRKWIMPKAVWIYGFLGWTLWGDDRGDYNKHQTRLTVKVDVL